jgi:ubiquinone/menaquinone biosynthesis C-methylase UbiE
VTEPSPLLAEAGRRFARIATDAVVRRPSLWRVFRAPLRVQFDRLASGWDAMRKPDHLAPFELALDAVDEAPRRALDLGTGTGAGAFAIARRFPDADVVGVDLADRMVEEALRNTPAGLADRVRFERGDASRLPFGDGSFELVGLANMIPFFDELARVVAPGGYVIFGFSNGPETPIYVPPERLRSELARRGFTEFAEFQAGRGTALLARKHVPG